MKAYNLFLATPSPMGAATAAFGRFVKGNEAVTVMPDDRKPVETPSLPSNYIAKACPADQIGCASGGRKMLETPTGPMECTGSYARRGLCGASTSGTETRPRIWAGKSKGTWLQCQDPDRGSKCGSIRSLSYDAIR